MKNIISILLVSLVSTYTIAQNSFTSNNAAISDFNNVANWTDDAAGGAIPNFSNGLDNFTIADGHNYQTTGALNIAALVIGQGGSAATLLLNDVLDLEGNMLIETGSTLTADNNQINMAGNWTEIGTGSLSSTGTVVFDAFLVQTISAAAAFNNLTFSGGGVVSSGGNVRVNGNWLITNNTNFSTGNLHDLYGNLTVDNGSIYNATDGRLTLRGSVDQALNIGTNAIFDQVYFQPGAAIDFNITGNFVANDLTYIYPDATLNGAGDHTIEQLIQNGAVNFSGSITFTGNRANDTDDNIFGLGTADIIIAGNYFFSNTTNGDAISIGGNLTIQSGYLVIDEGSVTGTGGSIFQINDGNTVYLRGVDNFPTGFGTVDFQGVTSRALYDLRANQTIRGGITYARLALGAASGVDTGSRIKTADGPLDINGYLDLNNGITLSLGGFSHTLEGYLYNNTNSSISGAAATLTLDAPDARQDIQSSGTGSYNLSSLIITNTAPTAVRTINIDDNNFQAFNFSVSNAGGSISNYLIVDIDANLMVGFGTYSVGANVELRTSGPSEFNSMMAFYAESLDAQSTILFDGTTQSIPGVTYGNVEIRGNGNKNATAGFNVVGNFSRVGDTPIFVDGGFNHTVTGNWVMNVAYTNNMTGSMDFNGTDQTISGSDFNNVSYSGSGAKSMLGNQFVSGDVTINNGVTVEAGIYSIDMTGGHWVNGGTGAFNQSTGSVLFSSTSTGQNITANPNNIFGDLDIDNNTRTVNAQTDIIVSRDFDLVQNTGDFNLQGFTLFVGRHFNNRTGTSFSFTLPAATVHFNGNTGQNIRNYIAGIYPNLTFSGLGEKRFFDNGLDINGDVTITNTTLDAANLSHTVAGDWNNGGSFQHTQAITFDGDDQNISASTFHDTFFSGTGIKTLTGNITLNGRLQINDGVTLDVGASSFKITVEESWTNSGTGVFLPQNGLVEFSGGYSQMFTGAVGFPSAGKQFWDVLINTNTSRTELDGDLIIENDFAINAGAELEMDAFDMYVAANFINNGTFDFNSNNSRLTFNGGAGVYTINPGGANFRHITVDANASSEYQLQSNLNFSTGIGGTAILIVNNGKFDLNGNEVTFPTNNTLNIDINGGTLEVDEGASLRLGRDSRINNNGGTFRVVGTASNPAVINSLDPDIGDYYSYAQTGGTIEAQYYSISNTTGNGVEITGGTIDPANNFSNGVFSNGAGTAYLTLNIPFTAALPNVIFNAGPTFNVSAPNDYSGALAVDFQDALGGLAGEANDNDGFNQIAWSFSGTGKFWDGGGDAVSWNDAANWSPDGIPLVSDVVFLDHSTVGGAYAVAIQGSDAIGLKLIIDAGGADDISLTVGNGRTLDIEELLTIIDGSLIQTDASTIRLAGAFSNSGTYTANTNLFMLDGTSGVHTFNTNSDPFYNLTVSASGAQYNLDNNLILNGDFLLLGGIFNVVGNQSINLPGNWTLNGGSFLPGTGAVNLTGTAGTQLIYGGLFYDLGLFGNANVQLTSNATIQDDFTITSGFGGIFDAQAFIVKVADDWQNNRGAAAFVQSGSGAVIFDGGGQNIGGSEFTTFNSVFFSGTGTKLMTRSCTITQDMNILSGIGRVEINPGVTVTGTGGGTLSQTGGQLRIEDTNNFPTGFGTVSLTGGEVFYYANIDQNIFATTYFDLRVGRPTGGNTPTKTLLGNITVNDDLVLNDTEVILAANNFIINLEDALAIPTGGQQVNWGTAGGTGTLNHFGNYWNIDADITGFNNLILGGSGGKYMNNALTITGDVIINDGILLDMNSNTMTGTGLKSFTMIGTSRVITENIADPLPAFPTAFGTYSLATTSRVTLDGSGNQIIYTTPTYGRLDVNSNNNATLDGNLNVDGDFYMNDNVTLIDGGFNINLAGSISDIRDYTPTPGITVTFDGADQVVRSGEATPIDYINLPNVVLGGSGTKILTGGQDYFRISGDLTINNSITVNLSRNVDFSGANFTNNGTLNHTANTINFNRTGVQTIDPGANHTFQTTRFENGGGTKSIINNGLNIDGGQIEFFSNATVDFGSLTHYFAITSINDDNTETLITANANLVLDRIGTQALVKDKTWSNITFAGSGNKLVGGTLTANDVIINNGVNLYMSSDYGTNIGDFVVRGNWTNAGAFYDYTSTVAFESTDTNPKAIDNNGFDFYNVTFNQTNTSIRAYTLQSGLVIQEDLTIGTGATLDVNGFNLTLGNNDGGNPDAEQHYIAAGATLIISPGSTLFFNANDTGADDTNDGDPTLIVDGTFNLVGASGNLARIDRSAGGYRIDIDIQSGGTINARFYEISTLVDAGLDVQVGANVATSGVNNNFSDGTWSGMNVANSGNRLYLNFEADATGLSDVNNVTFNHAGAPNPAFHFNVRRSAGAGGVLTFAGTINGLLAGETYEDDGDGTKIIWPVLSFTNWTGAISSDWSVAGNWDNGVPSNVLDAIIGLQTNNPIINSVSGNGAAKSVTLTNGILTLDDGNDLNSVGDVVIGQGTANGILAVANASSDVIISGGLTIGGNGIYIPGGGTFIFNAAGGTVTIRPNNSSLNNITFTGAATYLVSGTTIDIDGDINITNGTYSFSTNNYTATVGGDILNTAPGSFSTSTNGVVILDGAAQTIKDVDFNQLTVSGTLTKTLEGIINVNGDLIVNSTLNAGTAMLTMNDDVTIASGGTFNDGGGSHNFDGANWTGTGAYAGSGTIVFTRTGNQNIYASKFNNLDIAGTNTKLLQGDTDLTGDFIVRNSIASMRLNTYLINNTSGTGTMIVEAGESVFILGVNNFPSGFATYALDPTSLSRFEGTNDQTIRGGVQYGRLYLLNANTKTLGGDIDVDGDLDFNTATLDVSANNYEITLAGEWDNNDGGSFIARNGQVVLDGAVAGFQNIRANITGTKDFYDLRIDKSAGVGRYLANGVDVSVLNDLVIQNGTFRNEYTNRDLNVGGNINCIGGTIETDGRFVMNKTSGTGFITANGSTLFDLDINTGGTYLLQDNLTVSNLFSVTSGTFNGNGNTVQLGDWLDVVTIAGTYIAGAGGRLELGRLVSLTVTPSGTIDLAGTPGSPVTVTRRSTNDYNFSVQGTIRAQNYLFEYMGINGIKIENGAIIDATDNFSNGSFANGASGGTLLNIESTQDLTGNPGRIENVAFPSNPGGGASNVSKLIAGSGTIEFYDAVGAFAGFNFENDPGNLINWTGTETLIWTAGAGTSDWFTAGNWESSLGGNKVPTATDLVIIDDTPVIQPVVSADGTAVVRAEAKTLTINFGAVLTLNTSVDDAFPDLDVSGDITINGIFITNGAEDRIRIQGAWTRGGSGSFTQSTSRVDFATSGGVDVINNGTSPFYDLTIQSGNFQLGSNTFVQNDFTIDVGAIFDVTSSNLDLWIRGDFSNSGTFNAQQGQVVLYSPLAGVRTIETGGAPFYDLTINALATAAYNLQSTTTVLGDLAINGGTLSLNSNTLNVGDGIGTDILSLTTSLATLTMGANGTLSMGNNSSIQVTDGLFQAVGTDISNKAIINSQSGSYGFVVAGGQLDARFYEINNLNTTGLHLQNGAGLDAASNLSDGSFSSGTAGGRYLLLENDLGVDITLNNVVFNSGTAVNARRLTGTNNYIFNDASGVLAGSIFEDDSPANGDGDGRIRWIYTSLITWTGATSADWNTGSNWSGGVVPTAANDVLIPSGTLNDPLLFVGADGVAKDLTIAVGASMEFDSNGGAANLVLSGSFINSGTFTHTQGYIYVDGNWTNVGTYTAVSDIQTVVELNASTGNVLIETGGDAFCDLIIQSDIGGDGDAVFQTVDPILINCNIDVRDGTLQIMDPLHTISINNTSSYSTFRVETAGSLIHGNSTINLQSTGTGIILRSLGSNLYNIVTSGSGLVTLYSDVTIDNDLTLGADTDLSLYTITLNGNLSNTGTFTSSTSTVSLVGAATQTITSAGGISFNNLTVANSSGLFPQIILNDPILITGALTLTDGVIASSIADFVHLNGGSLSGGSAASYVDGPMQRTGDGDFTFPVGDGLFYARIGAESLGLGNSFTAQYFDAAAPNSGNVSQGGAGPLNHVSGAEYWELSRSAGASNPLVKLYWEDGTRSDITDLTGNDLVVAHYTASNWQSEGGTITGGSTTAVGSVTSTSPLTSLSPITFGSAFNVNALPIELLSFEAEALATAVKLTWSTASELNNDYFTLYRSKDGENYVEVTTIIGAGDSQEEIAYSFVDERPYNGISYYKLTQTDFDGTNVEVGIVLVRMSNNSQVLELVSYPNPFQNEAITLSLSGLNEEELVTVLIVDAFGKQQYMQKHAANDSGYLDVTVEQSIQWNSGVYVVRVISEKGAVQSRIVKQ
ncbi:MAG: T9SS type A sorting domain-containing protein [Cyclobacteriaceae bacterium]|nr:T9SS type A sorting domain-containing protein [Cyclobacteriaceae bacterium]